MISIYALLSQTIHGNEQKPEKQAVRFNEATATSPDYNPYPGTVRFNEETATSPDYNPYPGTVSKISSIFSLWLLKLLNTITWREKRKLKCRKHPCKNVIVALQGMIDGVYKHFHPE